jgi:Lrp/AsnC family leucine-responsive transcriptional regulator
MDEFDRKLLRLLQADNTQTFDRLGNRVGLSPSSVRRRVQRMRATGAIRADVSLVDAAAVGVTVIVLVRFEKESVATYTAFKKRMTAFDQVAQCYTVAGEVDFILVTHFPDLQSYDLWVETELLSDPAISRSTAHVVYRTVKSSTVVHIA